MIPAFNIRIAGFPVRIEATFFLMAAVLGQGRPDELLLTWIAVVFVSILVHELGHAVAFRAFGDRPRITLHVFGGLTHPTKTLPVGKDVVAAVAGSAAGLIVLGLPAYGLRASLGPIDLENYRWWIVLSDIVWVSGGWSLLNLLPVLPLDGGLVARRLLVHVRGRSGEVLALVLSVATAAGVAAFAFLRGQVYAGLFALYFVGRNAFRLLQKRDDRVRDRIREADGLIASGDRTQGSQMLRAALSEARTDAVRGEATEALAWASIRDGRIAEAAELADRVPTDRPGATLLTGCLALLEGRSEEGARTIADWWLAHPTESPGAVVIRHLAGSGAVGSVVDRALAAEGTEAVTVVSRLHYELHVAGMYEGSVDVGERLFEDHRSVRALAAYNVACSLSRSGRLGRALEWLDRAVDAGWPDARAMDADDDLTALRQLPRYRHIVDRIPSE